MSKPKSNALFVLAFCCVSVFNSHCRRRQDLSDLNALVGSPPKEGRSLFDYAIMMAPDQRVPEPFTELEKYLDQFGKRVAILAPLGRSAQNTLGMPNPFADPRRIVAYANRPNSKLQIGNKLFLGYVKGAKRIEVISYNETSGDYEFQLVTDYGDGKIPKIYYANKHVCKVCHQNGGPIITREPWSEFNGNNMLASLMLRYHPSGLVDDIPIIQRPFVDSRSLKNLTHTFGGNITSLVESEVQKAATLVREKFVWANACSDQKVICRGALVKVALFELLGVDIGKSKDLDAVNESLQSKILPTHFLNNRDLFLNVLTGLDATRLDPMQKLDAVEVALNSAKKRIVDFESAVWLPPGTLLDKPMDSALLDKSGPAALRKLIIAIEKKNFAPVSLNSDRSAFSGIDVRARPASNKSITNQEILIAEQFLAKQIISSKLEGSLDPAHMREPGVLSLSEAMTSMQRKIRADAADLIKKNLLIEKNLHANYVSSWNVTVTASDADKTFSSVRASIGLYVEALTPRDVAQNTYALRSLVGRCTKKDLAELNCAFQRPPNTIDSMNVSYGTIQLNLPLGIGVTSAKSSAIVINNGPQAGSYYTVCTATNSYRVKDGTSYTFSCVPFDLNRIAKAIADLVREENPYLERDYLDMPRLLNDVLEKLNLPPYAIPADDLERVKAIAEAGMNTTQVNAEGSLAVLQEHCGACHRSSRAPTSTLARETIPQFLAGATATDICRNATAYTAAIVAALEKGTGDASYMPPASEITNGFFSDELRQALINLLSDSPRDWCPFK